MDALTEEGDEGRGIAAICFGEVRSNLRSGGFRMGQPLKVNLSNFSLKRWEEHTQGSKTFQYLEEKRTIVIPLVAASETGSAQTQPQNRRATAMKIVLRPTILGMGVIRLQRWQQVKLQNA